MARLSIKKYQDMKITSAKNADPYELIQMVYNAILGKITEAKAGIERNDIAYKGKLISEVIILIGSLEESLDMENGGGISENLSNLYNFCSTHMVDANAENDVSKLDEVHSIILTLKQAWDQIPKTTRDEYLERDVANA
jgi:flagellar secretion chaperone FliS